MANKNSGPRPRPTVMRRYDGYIGFLDDRPHVQQEGGRGSPRTMTIYVSRAMARRAYEDVRRVRLVVDHGQ